MSKHYTLIVGHGFSLSNDTDADAMSDYSPGIWGIKTQKSALKYAREAIERGDEVVVTDYDNPVHHELANKFIKELGLKQPLFKVPEAVDGGIVTNGKPSNLSQLKKYLVPGIKVRVKNFSGGIARERDTFVREAHTEDVVFDKNGDKSWMNYGKASEWSFNNDGATHHLISREGKVEPSTRIEYL